MPTPTQSIINTRRDQMFPVLDPVEVERMRRFGKVRSYDVGEALVEQYADASHRNEDHHPIGAGRLAQRFGQQIRRAGDKREPRRAGERGAQRKA